MQNTNFDTQSDDTPRRRASTEAQRLASRLNGSKSRGPRSLAGKARSSANAMSEGLLAQKFMPPADFRELDGLFRQVRRELLEQFEPKTFTAQVAIDGLAHDFTRLARAHELIEAAARGAGLSPDEEKQWCTLRDTQVDLDVMTRLLAFTALPEGPLCDRSEARRLAQRITSLLGRIEADLAQAAADAAEAAAAGEPLPPVDEVDAEEDARCQALLQTLGDARPKFLDENHVLALLCGDRILAEQDWAHLRAVLTVLAEYARQHIRGNEDLPRRVEQLQRQNLQTLAAAPDQLLVWEEYAHGLERQIDGKLAGLRKWGVSG